MGRLHPIIGVIIFLYLFPKLHNLGVYENLYHASDPKSAFNLKIGFEKSNLWLWFRTQVLWTWYSGIYFLSFNINVKFANEILNGI